jgi:hypothetical protein
MYPIFIFKLKKCWVSGSVLISRLKQKKYRSRYWDCRKYSIGLDNETDNQLKLVSVSRVGYSSGCIFIMPAFRTQPPADTHKDKVRYGGSTRSYWNIWGNPGMREESHPGHFPKEVQRVGYLSYCTYQVRSRQIFPYFEECWLHDWSFHFHSVTENLFSVLVKCALHWIVVITGDIFSSSWFPCFYPRADCARSFAFGTCLKKYTFHTMLYFVVPDYLYWVSFIIFTN